MIDAGEKFLLRLFTHGLVVARKQVPRRVEAEQRHGMESLLSQFGRKDSVVGKRMAVDFAWRFVGQATLGRLFIARVHLLITFVAMKGPTPCVGQCVLLGL